MMNFRSVTTATVLAMAIASPAFAQGPHARSEAVQQRQQEARAYQYYRDDRFWPGEMETGLVGGAIGTAGAIAGAPFGYDRHDNSYDTYGRPYGW
jgi:hypothetical protein